MKSLIAFSCFVLALTLSAAIAFAIPVKTTIAPMPQVAEVVNGSYEIAVKTTEGWQALGSPGFGKWPSNKTFELGTLPVTKDGQIVIRLTQRGGGAAHIDTVRLGGSAPLSVAGGAENAKLKLFKRDLDVLEATKKTLVLAFPAGSGRLEITARVEPVEISKIPFTFPRQDVRSGADMPREFFTYMPGTNAGKLVADGLVDKGVMGKPMFRTFSATASGHPPTFTTGWVMDDGKYLYAAVDFAPDNTMDGQADYSRLYVKTAHGIKSFELRQDSKKYGRAGFVYTDEASYEHKYYEFKVPLEELGVQKDMPLELAFSAYGTAAIGGQSVAVAYDSISSRFMVAYKIGDDTYSIPVDGAGDPEGTATSIHYTLSPYTGTLDMAFDSTNQRFLTVWDEDNGSQNMNILGALLDSEGSVVTSSIAIGNLQASQAVSPVVAFDPVTERYLVAWQDDREGGDRSIYGKFLDASGTVLNATAFAIMNGGGVDHYQPAVEYDSANDRFMVLWDRNLAASIHGRIVNTNGTMGGEFTVTDGGFDHNYPALAYDSINGNFVTAWYDDRDTNPVYGDVLDADGITVMGGGIADIAAAGVRYANPVGPTNFAISEAFTFITTPRPEAAYSRKGKGYMVIWNDDREGIDEGRIYGQFINADGGLIESNVAIMNSEMPASYPKIAAGGECAQFLVPYTYWNNDGGAYELALTLLGESCPAAAGGGDTPVDDDDDDGGDGGGCFIATAAYGAYSEDHVMALREFRDNYLLTNPAGKAFVRMYYRYSPPFADFIAEHKALRVATRVALAPVVYGVQHPGAFIAAMVLGTAGGGLALRRRRKTPKKEEQGQ